MKHFIGIIVCLSIFMVSLPVRAVTYRPISPQRYNHVTVSQISSTAMPVADFRSTSSNAVSSFINQPEKAWVCSSSLSAISAANFEKLNAEDGEFGYTTSSQTNPGPRRVGSNDHLPDPYLKDPIGDVPWILFIILGVGYIAYRRFRTRRVE